MEKFSRKIFRAVKVSLSIFFYYSGLVALVRTFFGFRGIKILAYHRIADDYDDCLNMCIPASDFEAQIKYLCKNYHVVSLSEAVQLIQAKKKIQKNTVVITFDDGYKDNYMNAFPIMQKYAIPFTIFLSVEAIDNGVPLWYDQIVHLMRTTSKTEIDLSKFDMGCIYFKDTSARSQAIKTIIDKAKLLPEEQKQKLINHIAQNLGDEGTNKRPKNLMLSWDEIRAMKRRGVEFGAHTMSHPILNKISLEKAKDEIDSSRRIIEAKLGEKIFHFAYPNGSHRDFNESIIQLIQKSGFTSACTLNAGTVKNGDDLFSLKRAGIDRDFIGDMKFISRALFAVEMTGIFDVLFARFLTR